MIMIRISTSTPDLIICVSGTSRGTAGPSRSSSVPRPKTTKIRGASSAPSFKPRSKLSRCQLELSKPKYVNTGTGLITSWLTNCNVVKRYNVAKPTARVMPVAMILALVALRMCHNGWCCWHWQCYECVTRVVLLALAVLQTCKHSDTINFKMAYYLQCHTCYDDAHCRIK
jgi:hypothetical protein